MRVISCGLSFEAVARFPRAIEALHLPASSLPRVSGPSIEQSPNILMDVNLAVFLSQ